MKPILDFVDRLLSRVEYVVIAVFSLAALALGTAQVVMRYVFNTGFVWTEAIFVILTVSAMLFAGSRAVRDDAHVKVDLLPQLLPQKAQTVLRLIRYVASLGLCAVFVVGGFQYVTFTRSMGIVSPSSNLPVWTIYLIVPVTMGLFCIRYILLLLREAGGENTGHTEADEVRRAVQLEGDVK